MKILVVDDEPAVKDTFERFIGRMGHVPLIAASGARAIELYKEHRPEMVLLDINLTDMKGDKVFKEIIEFDKDAVVYFATGYTEDYLRALELQPAGYFHKPIMLDTIKKLIDQRKKLMDIRAERLENSKSS